ncbi:hypothetical protein AD949_06580 [Acetobacter orleanensis]|nr:hypothetical protein AD949_06580 [Acetobacter orleanensis]PCD79731.1 hypothetical protein CO710_05895 [Acetobacter orleanensis]
MAFVEALLCALAETSVGQLLAGRDIAALVGWEERDVRRLVGRRQDCEENQRERKELRSTRRTLQNRGCAAVRETGGACWVLLCDSGAGLPMVESTAAAVERHHKSYRLWNPELVYGLRIADCQN